MADRRTEKRIYDGGRAWSPRRRDSRFEVVDAGRDGPRERWAHDKYVEPHFEDEPRPPKPKKKTRWDVGDPTKKSVDHDDEALASSRSNADAYKAVPRGRRDSRVDEEIARSARITKRPRSFSPSSDSSSSSSSYYSRRSEKRHRHRRSRARSSSSFRSRSRSRSGSRDRSCSRRRHDSGSSKRRDKDKDRDEKERHRRRDKEKGKERDRYKEKGKERDRRRKRHRSRSRSPRGERRSVLTGKKIKMKVHKTAEDHERDEKREQLLQFLNSAYE